MTYIQIITNELAFLTLMTSFVSLLTLMLCLLYLPLSILGTSGFPICRSWWFSQEQETSESLLLRGLADLIFLGVICYILLGSPLASAASHNLADNLTLNDLKDLTRGKLPLTNYQDLSIHLGVAYFMIVIVLMMILFWRLIENIFTPLAVYLPRI